MNVFQVNISNCRTLPLACFNFLIEMSMLGHRRIGVTNKLINIWRDNLSCTRNAVEVWIKQLESKGVIRYVDDHTLMINPLYIKFKEEDNEQQGLV